VKSPTIHRRKRKLLEKSQAKMLLDLVDAEQGVGVERINTKYEQLGL
jgi:hypothetical protein